MTVAEQTDALAFKPDPKPVKKCRNGHELTENNIYEYRGNQLCRTCLRIRKRREYDKLIASGRKRKRGQQLIEPREVTCSDCGETRIVRYERPAARCHPCSLRRFIKHGRTVGSCIHGWGPSHKGETCCRVCGSTYILHLHHIIPRSKSRAARKDLRNGITLCASCHQRWHKHSLTIYRDIFTPGEWAYVSSVQLTGERIEAWLDKHYPSQYRKEVAA